MSKKVIQFDSQILSSFMECPRQMQYRFARHLVPIRGVSINLQKGLLAHCGLQHFYNSMKQGLGFLECCKKASSEARRYAAENNIDPEESVQVYRTLEEYFDYRSNDNFTVIDTERVFKIVGYEDDFLKIILTGRIDLLIRESQTNQLIPIDHKTESEAWFYSALSNQFKIYAIACEAQRLIVNRIGFQKTVAIEKKFKRDELAFDADILDEFKNVTIPYYAKQMLLCIEDNYFPPNHSSCIKGHFACNFSDKFNGGICSVSRSIREQKIERYFKVEKEWNPED